MAYAGTQTAQPASPYGQAKRYAPVPGQGAAQPTTDQTAATNALNSAQGGATDPRVAQLAQQRAAQGSAPAAGQADAQAAALKNMAQPTQSQQAAPAQQTALAVGQATGQPNQATMQPPAPDMSGAASQALALQQQRSAQSAPTNVDAKNALVQGGSAPQSPQDQLAAQAAARASQGTPENASSLQAGIDALRSGAAASSVPGLTAQPQASAMTPSGTQPYTGQSANVSAPAAPTPAPAPAPAPTPAPAPAAPAALTPAEQAQQAALSGLSSAQNSPDRVALANTTFQNLISSSDPAYQLSLRQAAANAAKYGRIGAGQTTSELDDLALARQRSLDTTASQLATDAAGNTLQDRLAIANAGLGQYSAYQGANQAAQNEADTAAYQTGTLANNATQNANTLTLGQGANANAAQANANTAAYQTGQLGVANGQLALGTTTEADQNKLANAQLALNSQLGLGQLGVSQQGANTNQFAAQAAADQAKAALAQQGSQFGQTFGQTQLEDDRNFALNDQVAAALASLNGTDLTSSGTDANGNPINATNLPTITTNGQNTTTPAAAANPAGPVIADNDPQFAALAQNYQKLAALAQQYGSSAPGQAAKNGLQQVQQAAQQYAMSQGATLTDAQKKALGISVTQFAPVTS